MSSEQRPVRPAYRAPATSAGAQAARALPPPFSITLIAEPAPPFSISSIAEPPPPIVFRRPTATRDPLFAWQRSGRGSGRAWWFAIGSLAIHAAIAGAVMIGGHASKSFAADKELIDVTVEPALGTQQGTVDGRGLGSHVETASAEQHHASHKSGGPKAAHTDPDGVPTSAAQPAAPTGSTSAPPDPHSSDSPAAAAASGDPATPVGSANVAPALGRTDGSETGTGTEPPKPRMTPQYAGQLAGWFGSRFNVRGLGLDPEELKKLSVGVSISISPDRHVTGFSLRGSSGNAAYDDEVRRTVAGIQASGVALPEPNDGSTPPASFAVRFRPLVIR